MAQSNRGALETWSEFSALLVEFCSAAESLGPRSLLANCFAPPRALCAIKDNCANDVQQHGKARCLLLGSGFEGEMFPGKYAISTLRT